MSTTLVFRTAGDWGPGKGANLTAAEVDENFSTLQTAIDDLTDSPLQPVSTTDFTVAGATFLVHLSDGTTRGPFPLPVATFKWTGAWEAGHAYNAFDLFYVDGDGLYTVFSDFESGTEFDPDETDTSGPVVGKMLGLIAEGVVTVSSFTADITLTSDEAGTYQRCTSAVPRAVTVPANADVPIDVNSIYTFRQAENGQLTFVGGVDVVINLPPTVTSTTRGPGSTVSLIKVGTNEWDLSGDMMIETTSG